MEIEMKNGITKKTSRHHDKNKAGNWRLWAYVFAIVLVISLCTGICYFQIQQSQKAQELITLNLEQKETAKAAYGNISASYQEVSRAVFNYLPGIVCWGDSLTAGAGGEGKGYPLVLSGLIRENISESLDFSAILNKNRNLLMYKSDYSISIPVENMGVGGENVNTILGRNGAIPFLLREDLLIPADEEAVPISMVSANGKEVAPLRQGGRGMESVTIDGIRGVINIEQDSYVSPEYQYFFVRDTKGESETVSAGTEIITSGSESFLDYLPVIFIGQNGGYDDIAELIAGQRAIINHQQRNRNRFIIIGLHTGTAESRAELEAAMVDEYGNQYINLREYMSTKALNAAGLEPTAEDQRAMVKGETPASLMVDGVHFNPVGYRLIGELIYGRMEELGYFDEVKEAIRAAMQPEK